ncbi:L-arabinose ABC transporter [Campylobacter sp. 19-13652]|uniref:L-arabinose ABC transporter n=1 Tax=Campylobacter sp. 19-13652 TaxID=2840180 RepID=UPI001C76ABB1|nr:L-arabinose ABC transporter [Campylobacter sp. 19-13652]BCX80211.1 hypothetical protein LBC_16730 [Campylobacter sp. 19-13652]
MCCFGVRVFALIFSTLLSFILHRIYPNIPVIGYYLLLVSTISFFIFWLFVRGALPAFVKPAAVHYFSAIGGVFGALLALGFSGRLGCDKFSIIEYSIAFFWLFMAIFVLLKFNFLTQFFGVLLNAS